MFSSRLLLLANGIAGASAFVLPLLEQNPMTIGNPSVDFKCDLPPVLDPANDGLPSALSLFSSDEALERQVKRHQAIVQVPSVSYDDLGEIGEDERWNPFYKLFPALQNSYPTIHKRAKLEKINIFGLLYTLEGSDPSLKPTLLTAHQDVVPVADASTWKYPPFEAHFDGEYIWGRGASDDKNSLTAILSAVEGLLSESDWKPRRTLLLAFGFDEEVGLNKGAGPISEILKERYGEDSVAIILDEGGFGSGPLDGNTVYVHPAITEKGHANLFFELHAKGGHSSVPLPHTGIGIVSEIVVALESNPYEPKIIENGPIHKRLICQARYSPNTQPEIEKLLRNNDFDGLAVEFAKSSPFNRFVVQTSQAIDLITGGVKINAMPEVVTLAVNYRVAHHEKPVQVQYKAIQVIADVVKKYGLRVDAFTGDKEYHDYVAGLHSSDMLYHSDLKRQDNVDYNGTLVIRATKAGAAPVSPASGPVWDIFSGTIRHAFASEDKIVVPVGDIMTGGTDTRYYLSLTRNVFRWTPAIGRGLDNIHTVDEHISIFDHLNAVRFYYDFIRNFDAADV
ncbi:carboxypeptidase S [Penicillium taxi]|uniref:carboxypeptidase S n=1 Tax=Penicillium taxi TaxID=168475 RepID=UPI002545AEAA|nr:carboxypeptidase S [Penicillium taxi]KAJ5907386.1 carboxypeptidase S [Penicillium taxi]